MKLPALLVSDLHLTDNPRDAYRWDLFPWLIKRCAQYHIRTLCFLGDLTDAKDFHSSDLVNRVVQVIASLAQTGVRVIIMAGNHDYSKSGHPYFAFLSAIPGVTFVTRSLDTSADGEPCLFLGHTRTPAADWAGLDLSHYSNVFIHQTFKGALSSNGQALGGEALPDLSAPGKVWSGDVHVPQVIGPVEYVGSPYPVHCGDSFKGRCIVLGSDRSVTPIHFRTISRLSLKITDPADLEKIAVQSGDHATVTLTLPQSEAHQWRTHRQAVKEWAERQGVLLVDLSMTQTKGRQERVKVGEIQASRMTEEELLETFCRRHELGGDALHVGLGVLQ